MNELSAAQQDSLWLCPGPLCWGTVILFAWSGIPNSVSVAALRALGALIGPQLGVVFYGFFFPDLTLMNPVPLQPIQQRSYCHPFESVGLIHLIPFFALADSEIPMGGGRGGGNGSVPARQKMFP